MHEIGELGPDNDDRMLIDDKLFEQLLAKESIAARVRATLSAGIRSAYLWTQLGGRRWHLFLKRRWYSINAGLLLTELGNLDLPGGVWKVICDSSRWF